MEIHEDHPQFLSDYTEYAKNPMHSLLEYGSHSFSGKITLDDKIHMYRNVEGCMLYLQICRSQICRKVFHVVLLHAG